MSMQQQEEEDASRLQFGPEFTNAKCLMNAEVAHILERTMEARQESSLDPLSQMNEAAQVLEKCLQYVKRFSRYENPEALKQVREVLASRHLHDYEVCIIANLAPDSVDEVKTLVPSLVEGRDPPIEDDEIEQMLQDLRTIRTFE